MKKIYILGLMGAFSSAVIAQPTLTQANSAPTVGEEFLLNTTTWDGTDPSTGASQIWDYSGLTATGSITTEYLATSDCPGYETFPEATVGSTSDGGSTYGFNDYTATANLNYGYQAGATSIYYDDPEQQLAFPFTFESAYTDDFTATVAAGGATLDRAGSITVEAVGYGTLILPSGTIENVLLIKQMQDYGDSFGGMETGHYITVIYQFLLPGVHYPLLSFNSITISGGDPIYSGQYSGDPALSITNEKTVSLNLYPNPVVDNLTIQLDSETAAGVESVQIFDMTGSIVYSTNSFSSVINTSDFNAGVYYIKLKTAEGEIVRKFVKA